MSFIVEVEGLTKIYDDGHQALAGVDLQIHESEILALLGPNGAGKTTLISTICGMVNPTSGTVRVGGHDHITEFKAARRIIGLVPQEISLEPFEKVINTVRFSRGLFGKSRDDAYLEKILKQLSLWDKKDSRINRLSGGMRRRVLIAKALAHEPRVLFLDEPTAGVDVELRRDMWEIVRGLKRDGVTIILTTHYIEEAEAIADRVGVIDNGKILLVREKSELMDQMGGKELRIELQAPIDVIPETLSAFGLRLEGDRILIYDYDSSWERTGITKILNAVSEAGLTLKDVATKQSSLEDIFVGLVGGKS
ncbi:MAG: ABC transporter ATP-binding protein [Litoreibacter sp.]